MSARVEHQPAYILHRRPYRETSWLLDLLTPDCGKISMVAKGARQTKNRDAALYQPFQPLFVSWLGRSALKTLTSIELRPFDGFGSDSTPNNLSGERLFAGFYLNELLEVLLSHQDPAPGLFALYESTVLALCSSHPLESTLRQFEKLLLDELGVGLSFEYDAESGEPIEADASYLFLSQNGFIHVDSATKVAYDDRTAPLVVPGRALLAIARQELDSPDSLRSAKRIMRRCIDDLLNGRELRSRELIRQYKESQRA